MATTTGSSAIARYVTPYLLVAPGLVLVLGILGYGVVAGFVLSLHEVDMFMNRTFVGFANYVAIFNDPRFQESLLRTLLFVVASIVLGLFLSLVFALTLQAVTFGKRFFRGFSLVPYFVSGIAAAVMWRFLFSTNVGFVNLVLGSLGLPHQSWLGDPVLAFVVAVMANCWFMVPFSTLIILGGLLTIDKDVFDAAKIDGASPIAIFFRISMPLIMPMLGVGLIWLSYASFSTFDIILALTSGGPFRATEVVSLYMYQVAFQQLDFGEGAVLMVVLLSFNLVLSMGYLYFFVLRANRYRD